MNKRFHKKALSVTTAVLTLTAAVTTANAAQRNEITIESDKSSVSGGDTFNITVGYEPDATGASGFTIDLHYDTDAVDLNVPDDEGYDVVNGFAIVTNFEADEGVVRLVGANLSGANVTKSTDIAELSFTVKDGYHGDIDFWTDVVTLVAADGVDFVNVEFNTHGPYKPYSVSGPAEESSSVPATTTEEIKTTTEEIKTTTTAEEPEIVETTPETTTTVQTSPLPEEIIPTTTAPQTTPAETSAPEESEITEDEPDENETDGALFSYTQGDNDYNNEEALQYSFSPYDYIDSADEPVDISVSVSSTGSAQGGIGMQTSDGWKIYSNGTSGGSDQIWTAENVDLSDVSGNVAVQLYYLKHNSSFSISSISVVPSSGEVADQTPDDNENNYVPNDPLPESGENDEAVTETPTEEPPAVTTVPDDSDENDSVPADTSAAEDGLVSSEVPSDTQNSGNTDVEIGNTSGSENNGEPEETTTTAAAQDVQQAVSDASDKADTNPDTGSGIGKYICGGIMALCIAQMGYSIYALTRKNEE